MNTIIPITNLRRNFGEITAKLPYIDELILTKGGEPFATMRATPNTKKKALLASLGGWKQTELDNDRVWKDVLKKKSRKAQIDL